MAGRRAGDRGIGASPFLGSSSGRITEAAARRRDQLKRSPEAILRKAARLGVTIKRTGKGKRDANFRGFAHRSRSPLFLGRKLQPRHALGWRSRYATIYIS
jgi:hypothetical protein